MLDVIIIGGGAGGFFCANILKEKIPSIKLKILEKTSKTLSKVKVSGGGRCNVTNSQTNPVHLAKNYPRGEKFLKPLFKEFGSKEVFDWFNLRGAQLKHEDDGRVFPKSNSSQTIVDILRKTISPQELLTNVKVESLEKENDFWIVKCNKETFQAKNVVVASGGLSAKNNFLKALDVNLTPQAPSLFTFNLDIPASTLKTLQGVAVQEVKVQVPTTKLVSEGPLLFTHWGLSGPAILKLSSWGARELESKGYHFLVQVNFANRSFEECKSTLEDVIADNPKKQIANLIPFSIPKRAWFYILSSCDIEHYEPYENIAGKKLNKLITQLTLFEFNVVGKSVFKEEFVTCGGVDLKYLEKKTCQHLNYKGLYFAGEVMDIDAITGGFNFQAAWTTAYIAAKAISSF